MPNTINVEYANVPIGDLSRHPRNPRRGNVAAIRESIEVNGFYGVVVVQRSTGRILAGNHRYQAAVEVGHDTVPVAWVDVDDDTALRILLADNRTNDLATYDELALASLLTAISATSPSLAGTGYDPAALQALLAKLDTSFPNETGEPQLGGLEFKVLVECKDEQAQARLIEQLETEGFSCRAWIS